MEIFKFLSSKTFIKHLFFAVAGLLILLFVIFRLISSFTRHGEVVIVPELVGIPFEKIVAGKIADDFELILIDSVYDDKFERGAVYLQDPPAGSKVKSGRKIYLTVVATQPEKVKMPDLVDLSLRQAIGQIEGCGLKLDRLEYVENLARNAVLEQKFEDRIISPGTEIQRGSSVTIVLGKGLNNEKTLVPFLIGMNEVEATSILHANSLNLGYRYFTGDSNPEHFKVYRQVPVPSEIATVDPGTYVDLWLRSDLYYDFDSLVIHYKPDTLDIESRNIDSSLINR